VTFDEVTLSHPQGQGVADAISTPLHAPPTPASTLSLLGLFLTQALQDSASYPTVTVLTALTLHLWR